MKETLNKVSFRRIGSVSGIYTALIIAFIIWGANFVVAKITLGEIPVMTLAFLRFALSSLALSPILWIERKSLKMKIADLPRLLIVGVLMVVFHVYLFYEGLSRTSSLNASVLTLVTPIISLLTGWWFLKEKVFWVNLLGSTLGLVGALIILGLPLVFTSGFNLENLFGNLLIFLSSVVFVAGAIISKPLFKSYHYLIVTIGTFLVGTLAFAVPATLDFLNNPAWIYKVSVFGLLGLLYITILSTIVAFFLYNFAYEKVGLARSTLFGYLNPAITASLAVPFLNERISFSFIIGTCLVILGVYWGTLGKEGHHHHILKHHR